MYNSIISNLDRAGFKFRMNDLDETIEVSRDGGEWLRNGGEFSHLESIPESMWDMIEKTRK